MSISIKPPAAAFPFGSPYYEVTDHIPNTGNQSLWLNGWAITHEGSFCIFVPNEASPLDSLQAGIFAISSDSDVIDSGSTDSEFWWGIDWAPEVDFAVWILQVDGLRVEPFVSHAVGSFRLSRLGLDADGWLSWVGEMVTRRFLNSALAIHHDFARTAWWQLVRDLSQSRLDPASSWRGSTELGSELGELWMEYANARDRAQPPLGHDLRQVGQATLVQEWNKVQRFRGSLPMIQAFAINYPNRVVHPVRPAFALISGDASTYADQIAEAARRLVSS